MVSPLFAITLCRKGRGMALATGPLSAGSSAARSPLQPRAHFLCKSLELVSSSVQGSSRYEVNEVFKGQ